jgi:chaperone required for assembly of F1-ATPase
MKRMLSLPARGLAEVVAAEWEAQEDAIVPDAMPITRLATTANDRMPKLRKPAIDEIVDYVATDLVCYRAPDPDELARRQLEAWQPPLDWMERRFGLRFEITGALLPTAQPDATVRGVRRLVEAAEDWPLVGLHAAVTGLGSVVLGLALWHGEIEVDAAVDANLLDALFEIERWGEERDAARRHERLRRDMRAAAAFLNHLPSPRSAKGN